ncbi:protein-S-isoprenylcysteine O-methyltransferase Ste14 [Streptacidiphilus sp. MAP12-20]
MSMDTGPDTHRLPDDPFEPEEPAAVPARELPARELTPLPSLPAQDEGALHGRELRPEGRLRVWQLIPIVGLAILGSLMFAFPLAFEGGAGGTGGSGGSLVGMLGLLLTAASAGWGAMAARRAGYAWPGLPRQGSGRRAGWRPLLAYTATAVVLLALGVWRVAHLHG